MKESSKDQINYDEILNLVESAKTGQKNNQSGNLSLFFGTILLFVMVGILNGSIQEIMILTFVLLIHELGHLLGMYLLKYRNLKIFFVPFVGAAASGIPDPENRSTSREAIISLMGPAPGIVFGIILTILFLKNSNTLMRDFASMFLILNGLNLLPFPPLDGGQLFNDTVFKRNKFLESAFLMIAFAGLVLTGIYLESPLLAIIGVIPLISIPYRFKESLIRTQFLRLCREYNVSQEKDVTMELKLKLLNIIHGAFPALFTNPNPKGIQTIAGFMNKAMGISFTKKSRIGFIMLVTLIYLMLMISGFVSLVLLQGEV